MITYLHNLTDKLNYVLKIVHTLGLGKLYLKH